MRRLTAIASFVLALMGFVSVVAAQTPVVTCGPCTASWTAPIADSDGAPLTETLTYTVYVATAAGGPYTVAGTTTATSLVLKGLGNGPRWAAVTAKGVTTGESLKTPDFPFVYVVTAGVPGGFTIKK